MKKVQEQALQENKNWVDKTGSIRITREDEHTNRLPLLDARLTEIEDGYLKMAVYRQPIWIST